MRFFFLLESNVSNSYCAQRVLRVLLQVLVSRSSGCFNPAAEAMRPRGGALLALLTPRRRSAYREGDRAAALC